MADNNTPIELVRAFCAAWSRRDPAELIGYFTDDAVYHNIPMRPLHGREAIAGFLNSFVGNASNAEFEVRHIAAAGDVVLTERVDRFTLGEATIDLPVAGVFEVRDGKVAAWRDYFDLATWTTQQAAQA
ncbi:MAG: SgcJ/EcaC family oxidoreductase [Dehalococcoidia bacterium]